MQKFYFRAWNINNGFATEINDRAVIYLGYIIIK